MDKVAKGIYEFGPYRLDATERMLKHDGESVEFTPQRFDLLLYLAVLPLIPHDPAGEESGEIGRGMEEKVVSLLCNVKIAAQP